MFGIDNGVLFIIDDLYCYCLSIYSSTNVSHLCFNPTQLQPSLLLNGLNVTYTLRKSLLMYHTITSDL